MHLSIPRCVVAAGVFAAAATAQNVLFDEKFNSGMPGSWSQQALGVPIDSWDPGVSPATGSSDVFHEWFCGHGTFYRINVLVSPPIDLTGFTQVDFSCVQHQTFPLARAVNRVDVSIDGGTTFTPLYTETGTWSGAGVINANMNAYAGLPDVRVAFRYEGAASNEWRIDDVKVTTPQPVLSLTGTTVGGTAVWSVVGGTPNSLVVWAVSVTGPGPIPSPFGLLGLTPPFFVLPVVEIADASGDSSTSLFLDSSTLGITIYTQSAEVVPTGEIRLSNWTNSPVL